MNTYCRKVSLCCSNLNSGEPPSDVQNTRITFNAYSRSNNCPHVQMVLCSCRRQRPVDHMKVMRCRHSDCDTKKLWTSKNLGAWKVSWLSQLGVNSIYKVIANLLCLIHSVRFCAQFSVSMSSTGAFDLAYFAARVTSQLKIASRSRDVNRALFYGIHAESVAVQQIHKFRTVTSLVHFVEATEAVGHY